MRITIDDLSGAEIAAFLDEHINDMKDVSPPESKHALDLEGLRKPEVTFWTVRDNHALIGCGALLELNATQAEIKSMRTSSSARNQGVASTLLQHMLTVARERSYHRLSLETGSMPFFKPARQFYERFGFIYCEPFANYKEDPNSVFMTLEL